MQELWCSTRIVVSGVWLEAWQAVSLIYSISSTSVYSHVFMIFFHNLVIFDWIIPTWSHSILNFLNILVFKFSAFCVASQVSAASCSSEPPLRAHFNSGNRLEKLEPKKPYWDVDCNRLNVCQYLVHEHTLICDIHLHVKMQRYIMRSNMTGAGSENRIHTNA